MFNAFKITELSPWWSSVTSVRHSVTVHMHLAPIIISLFTLLLGFPSGRSMSFSFVSRRYYFRDITLYLAVLKRIHSGEKLYCGVLGEDKCLHL